MNKSEIRLLRGWNLGNFTESIHTKNTDNAIERWRDYWEKLISKK